MANGRYAGPNAPVSLVHTNTNQEIIQITDDKLRLILKDNLSKMEAKNDWIAPLSTLIAVITVFVSSDFKDALMLPASTWRAIFIIIGVGSCAWLLKAIRSASKSPSLEAIVRQIKNSTTP